MSFSVSFLAIFGTAMSRQAKENVCDVQSIPVRLHCPFENCHKSYNSKKHINEHFLSTAMDRHVLNSKATPQAARDTALKFFMTSPDHLAGMDLHLEYIHTLGPVSRKSGNFSGVFRVT